MRKFLAAVLAASTLVMAQPAWADAKFEAFIQSLWPRVKAAGFSRELFDSAFAGVSEPDQVVLKLAKTQPEGGRAMLGTSPARGAAAAARWRSDGVAASSARV